MTNKKNGLNRRAFLGTAALGTAAVGAAGLARSCTTPSDQSSDAAASTMADGEKKARLADLSLEPWYKYQSTPATVMDFGLTPEQEDRAKELHSKSIVLDFEPEVDWHPHLMDNFLAGGAKGVGGSFTIDALHWGKLFGIEEKDKMVLTKEDWWTMKNIEENVQFIKDLETSEGKNRICLNSADIDKTIAEGRVVMMLDAQNGFYIGNQLDNIKKAYDLGIRRTQLAYNRGGGLASGCMDPRDGGLKAFGKECIQVMNEVGMIVDVGHSSPLSMWDAIDASSKPILCSHAGLRTISPKNPRTHTDKGLKKLADHGGILGVVGSPSTFTPEMRENADVMDFLKCIDYAVKLMGVDHVGFALDQIKAPSFAEFLTSPDWPPEAVASVNVNAWPWSDTFKGMENHSGYPNITRGLISMGYSDEDIMKVLGGNFYRFIKENIG